jgi:hypothetical protein
MLATENRYTVPPTNIQDLDEEDDFDFLMYTKSFYENSKNNNYTNSIKYDDYKKATTRQHHE